MPQRRVDLAQIACTERSRHPMRLGLSVPIMDEPSALVDLGVGLGKPPSEYSALGRTANRRVLAAMLDESLEVVSGLWSGQPFTHHGDHYSFDYSFDDVQFLPTPLQRPRPPVWVSAMARNEHTLGRAGRWDGVILGAMSEGAMGILEPQAVAEVAARPDAPADIVVAAPCGTDPAPYEEAGATWVLFTDWLDELRRLASASPPR